MYEVVHNMSVLQEVVCISDGSINIVELIICATKFHFPVQLFVRSPRTVKF